MPGEVRGVVSLAVVVFADSDPYDGFEGYWIGLSGHMEGHM